MKRVAILKVWEPLNLSIVKEISRPKRAVFSRNSYFNCTETENKKCTFWIKTNKNIFLFIPNKCISYLYTFFGSKWIKRTFLSLKIFSVNMSTKTIFVKVLKLGMGFSVSDSTRYRYQFDSKIGIGYPGPKWLITNLTISWHWVGIGLQIRLIFSYINCFNWFPDMTWW